MSDTNGPDLTDWDEPITEDVTTRSADEKDTPAPSSSDSSEAKSRFSKKLVFGTFFVAFTVIGGLGVLAYVLFGPSNGDNATTEPAASSQPNTATVADDFDRPDNTDELGNATTGQTWDAPSGTWGIVDQQAQVVTPNADELGRSWAVIELGSGNGSVTATAAKMVNGWGLVFRYRGPFNYWTLQASTEYATYNLVKVVDGELESITKTGIGLAPIDDGTKVEVQFQGPTISVLLNDQIVGDFSDPDLQNETKVGMIVSSGGATTARWEDFTAQAAPREAVGGDDGGG